MPFELKPTRKKVPSVYKSLYINERLVEQLDRIAKANETSFNNVVISMIEHCLAEGAEEKTKIETEKTQA